MVLELLVPDEERDHDQAAKPVRLDEDDGGDDDGRDRRAGERDKVENRYDEAERDRIVAADGEEDDRGRSPGDEAEEEVARDVAADRAVHLTAHPLVPQARAVGSSESVRWMVRGPSSSMK